MKKGRRTEKKKERKKKRQLKQREPFTFPFVGSNPKGSCPGQQPLV
jgi:hypothetical protein